MIKNISNDFKNEVYTLAKEFYLSRINVQYYSGLCSCVFEAYVLCVESDQCMYFNDFLIKTGFYQFRPLPINCQKKYWFEKTNTKERLYILDQLIARNIEENDNYLSEILNNL